MAVGISWASRPRKTSMTLAVACGFALAPLFMYCHEFSSYMPSMGPNDSFELKPMQQLIAIPDDKGAAPASMFKRLQELEREVAVLKRKSWSEHLDPQTHYRFKYYTGKVTDAEDRSHVEPFYLGHMLNTTKAERRVYIDLGMRTFQSSLCYMLQSYPAHFDEMYGFECCYSDDGQTINGLPPLKAVEVESCISQGNKYHAANYTTEEVIDMTELIWAYVDTKDNATTTPPKISFNKYLESLELAEDDFVVLKMDIEGMEYPVLNALLAEPRLSVLIDELMVEMHYKHPEMAQHGWDIFDGHDIADAHVMLQKARDAGIVVHPWP